MAASDIAKGCAGRQGKYANRGYALKSPKKGGFFPVTATPEKIDRTNAIDLFWFLRPISARSVDRHLNRFFLN
jgi:hypothetical protein